MNAKLRQFVLDKAMSEAVKQQLVSSFLKKRADRDVQILAAQQLAVEFLNDAWSDMKRLQGQEIQPEKRQVGI